MANGSLGTSASIGLLFMRLGAGGLLLWRHGWPKVMHFAERAGHFSDPLGVGHTRSYMVAIFAEVLCAVCVMLGFGTRYAAVPIVITMGVVVFMVSTGHPFIEKELALAYAWPFLALVFTGGGRFALDTKFEPRVTFKGGK